MSDYFTLLGLSLATSVYCAAFLCRSYRHGDLASPSSIYSGLVLLHFALPGLLLGTGLGPRFINTSNMDFVDEAALYVLCGLVAVQVGAGAFISRRRIEHTSESAVSQRLWVDRRVAMVLGGLLAVGWIARVYIVNHGGYFQIERGVQGELEGPFFAAIRLLEELPNYALGIFAIRAFRNELRLTRFWRRLFIAQLLLELIYWLPTGRKEETILLFVIPAICWYLVRRQLPSKILMLGFAAFLAILFPAMHIYRVAMELSGSTGNVVQVVQDTTATIENSRAQVELSPMDIALGRISLLESMSTCVRLARTGGWTVQPGQSYLAGLYGFIPRFLWQGKPNLHYGTDFGVAAGMIGEQDTVTSISISFPGESFLNFGWFGLLPLCGLGAFFGWVYRFGWQGRNSETGMLVYMILLPTLLYIGGTFALFFGGLIKSLSLFLVLGRFMEIFGRKNVARSLLPVPMTSSLGD